ncbi:YcgN family cysteine cluster protein [Parvibaculum sp.]|uniref:YcgN family cysteine cluster protein n=1 Tax=Parvibaculum sp. TaxID=2024848 RepID=UPI003210EA2F
MKRKTDLEPFWKRKTLEEMTRKEWESLCDGCAKCCLVKLEDEDTLEISFTSSVCKLLDCDTCRCKDYPNRSKLVPDCVQLTPEVIYEVSWMPPSCAYRLIAEGKDLPSWHPLVSGETESVHRAGMSVRGKVISEEEVDFDDICDYIVDWPKLIAD